VIVALAKEFGDGMRKIEKELAAATTTGFRRTELKKSGKDLVERLKTQINNPILIFHIREKMKRNIKIEEGEQ
jgi:hypothetical protein